MAIKSVVNMSIGTIEWTFEESGKTVVLHAERVSDTIKRYAVFHGLKQKGVDSMALSAKDFGGRVPESAKLAELVSMVEYLESGTTEWNQRATGERATGGLLVQALVELSGGLKTVEEARAYVKTLSKDQSAAMLVNPKIKAIVDAIRAKSVDETIDTDAMLTEWTV